MDRILHTARVLLSMVLSYLFGGFDCLMQLLCLVMAIDFISGMILATVFQKSPKTKSGALNSKTAVRGLMRKVSQLLLIVMITRLSVAVGDGYFCRNTAILFFVAGECISILENMGMMGVSYPDWIQKGLEMLQNSKTDK
ncbi:MAG: phage holin family protein [Clostridia bacterium]|nr:phage holin family protein [Clostridia bacterium]